MTEYKSSFHQVFDAFNQFSPGGSTKVIDGVKILYLRRSMVESRPNGFKIVEDLNKSQLVAIDKIEIVEDY